MNTQYITAEQIQTILGVGRTKAYAIVRKLNKGLTDMGLAKLFHKVFHQLICYVLEPKSWYIYNVMIFLCGKEKTTLKD